MQKRRLNILRQFFAVSAALAAVWLGASYATMAAPENQAAPYDECLYRGEMQDKTKRIETCTALLEYFRSDAPDISVEFVKNAICAWCEKDNTPACLRAFRISTALKMRSAAYAEANELDRAFADIDEALRTSPKWYELYWQRIDLSVRKRDFTTAVGDADFLKRKYPRRDDIDELRCWVRVSEGSDLKLARRLCDAALRKRPQNPEILEETGVLLLKAGDYQAAFDSFQSASRWSPSTASYIYGRGVAARLLGRTEEGESLVGAAKKIEAKVAERFEIAYNLGALARP